MTSDHLTAGTGSGGSRIDVKRLIGLRPTKNKMETRLDDNKIQLLVRQCHWLECTRAPCEELALPKSVESGSLGVKKIPRVLDVRQHLLRAKEAGSEVSTAAIKSPLSHRLPRKRKHKTGDAPKCKAWPLAGVHSSGRDQSGRVPCAALSDGRISYCGRRPTGGRG